MVNGHATLLYYILAVKHNSVVFIQKFNALTFGLAFWKGSSQHFEYPNKTKTMLLVY